MTVQSSIGAVPITALDPPPEGLQSSNFAVTLTQLQPNFAASLQLNSQSGLSFSQVTSLYVDNQLNPVPITLIHGPLNEVTIVAAGAAAIVPTMSSGGYYSFNVSVPAAEISPVTGAVTFNIVFSNYMRHKATFSTVVSQSIVGDNQNTQSLFSGISDQTPFIPGSDVWNQSFQILPQGNYILDSLDFCVEGIQPFHGGGDPVNFFWQIAVGNALTPDILASGQVIQTVSNTNWFGGFKPVRRTWWKGLLLERGASLFWTSQGLNSLEAANVQTGVFRFNVSGGILS